jgi:hypothetical protein
MDPSQRKRNRDRVRYLQMTPHEREIYLQRNREYKRRKRAASASGSNAQSVIGDISTSTNGNIHLPTKSSTATEGTMRSGLVVVNVSSSLYKIIC